ncbi:MAG: type I restriction enzyme HsdR N-terminal domain-containing protein [Bacteroidia bacterium]
MKLNFPEYSFRIIKEKESLKIFDPIRKKYVVLTPEEWVRQHVIQHLILDCKIPPSLIAIERAFEFNHLKKRFDILVFNNQAQPSILVECKSFDIELSSETLMQISTYNQVFNVRNLWISNGIQHHSFQLNESSNGFIHLSSEKLIL